MARGKRLTPTTRAASGATVRSATWLKRASAGMLPSAFSAAMNASMPSASTAQSGTSAETTKS